MGFNLCYASGAVGDIYVVGALHPCFLAQVGASSFFPQLRYRIFPRESFTSVNSSRGKILCLAVGKNTCSYTYQHSLLLFPSPLCHSRVFFCYFCPHYVIPAKAGIQLLIFVSAIVFWISGSAGMTLKQRIITYLKLRVESFKKPRHPERA